MREEECEIDVVEEQDNIEDETYDLIEVKGEPNIPFPDGEYGIKAKYRDYSLVKKVCGTRIGTEKDGENCGKKILTVNWRDVNCFSTTVHGCVETYSRIKTLSTIKKKKALKDFSELVAIYKDTHDEINKVLKCCSVDIDDKQEEMCNLIDAKHSLQAQISQLKSELNEYKKISKDIDKMYQEIKDKRTIIVNVDKPKKHREIKEEE